MADDKASTEPGENDAPKRKRRVLRQAAQPTTLREQIEQAQAKVGRPRRRSRVLGIIAVPFRYIAKPFKFLGRFRLFRAIGYVLFPPYFRNSFRELMLVTWPDRRETRRLVLAVIIFSLTFGIIVAGVDWGLDKAFRAFVLKK